MAHEHQQTIGLGDQQLSLVQSFEDTGFLGGVATVESSPTTSRASPPEFRPVLEGRLFTAHDATVGADCEVHPSARLSHDSLPPEYREVFKNCPMYLEKHLEFVRYLQYLSLDETQRKNQPFSEKQLIQSLGISINTEDKKKWQCGVVGCEYTGTLQHLASHLRTRSHIGIRTFSCTLDCKIFFHHAHDRDRHVKDRICMKPHTGEDSTEPHGSTHSVRGVQEPTRIPKSKMKSRENQQLARGKNYQTPAQTSAQGIADPRTRNDIQHDLRLQAYRTQGNYTTGIPSTSSAPPPQPLGIPLHLTPAYHQTHLLNVSPTQHGDAGLHPANQALQSPEIFPTIRQTNFDGMRANIITNNNYIYPEIPQRTINPRHASTLQQVDEGFNPPTALLYGQPCPDPRMTVGYQNPGQPSTSNAHFVANIDRGNPPQGANGRPHYPRQPLQYEAQYQGQSYYRTEGGVLQMNSQVAKDTGSHHRPYGYSGPSTSHPP